MELWVWIVLAIAVVAGIGVAAFTLWQDSQRRASSRLRDQFGSVYDETVSTYGDKREAERDLKARQQRVQRLRLRPLSNEERADLESQWTDMQSGFIEDPSGAAEDADALVDASLTRRGYPPSDFERRLDDLSVEHPEVVRRYRTARTIVTRDDADTEALRQAVLEYRAVFVDLANADVEVPTIPARKPDLAKAS
jgi:hypothetical protein